MAGMAPESAFSETEGLSDSPYLAQSIWNWVLVGSCEYPARIASASRSTTTYRPAPPGFVVQRQHF